MATPRTRRPRKARSLQRWVIKAGSNLICSGGPLLIRAWMHDVALLKKEFNTEVVWVTSGAIASAVDRTEFKRRSRNLSEKQALSAIGQPRVMDLYNLGLQAQGHLGAQILLTYDDLAHKTRRECFTDTIEQLLKWGVTPILNENDAVATEEIKFGDNDSLSAKVADTLRADRLVILTDVDGLFQNDPRQDPHAKRIEVLPEVTSAWLARVATQAGSSRGTGGMYSKLKAAREASEAGIETSLVRGDFHRVLIQLAEKQSVGTQIRAQKLKNQRRRGK